ncbi:MAG: hypothetical protein IT236_10200 [Bacteroidia bacterium]|nr:hypothetical protein [Bacteroidia bacterium]
MEKLFTEFKPSSAADWKNQLIKELKGEDYSTLQWNNENGITIEPFYTSEDLKHSYTPAFTHSDWEICVKGKAENTKELNRHLLNDLNRGASAIEIIAENHSPEEALEGISLQHIHSSFFLNSINAGDYINYLRTSQNAEKINASLFPSAFSSQEDIKNWNELTSKLSNGTGIKTNSFNALPFHNQNCLAYYEVAITLSALVELLENKAGLQTKSNAAFVVKTGVSADYFMQMAKLRTLRRLWEVLKKEYNINNDLHIIAETSAVNKSISDAYNNLLRTTIEAMAAVAGGCNELVVNGFDLFFATNPDLSQRMAINQQLILKNESYFDKMADVACGSYYIETLTDTLAERSLSAFKDFEKQGGYFQCLAKKVFINEIQTQANEQAEKVNALKQLAVGVNKFKNDKEKINLSQTQVQELAGMAINNPVLSYELKHFFNHA